MSRGREWAEELAELAARGHGAEPASDARGRVVLTIDQRRLGLRATQANASVNTLLLALPAIRRNAEELDRVMRNLVAAVGVTAADAARAFDRLLTPLVERALGPALEVELGRRACLALLLCPDGATIDDDDEGYA